METLKTAALLALLWGIVQGSWAWIFGSMVLWEIGGGFFMTSLFYFTNRSSHHGHDKHDADHGS